MLENQTMPIGKTSWLESALMLIAGAVLLSLTYTLYEHGKTGLTSKQWLSGTLTPNTYVAVDMSTHKGSMLPKDIAKIPRTKKLPALAIPRQTTVAPKHKQETGAELVGRIVRTLVLDEVDSFVQRANMVSDVAKHLSEE